MRTKALIIKKQFTNEHDQLVVCYTEELGKMTLIAKSVLKHSSTQGMQLEVGNLVEFEVITGNGVPIIAAAHTENAYREIKSSLALTATAAFFLEVVDKIMYEQAPDDRFWNFLTELLDDLERHGQGMALLSFFRAKQLELLDILGYAQPAEVASSRETFHSALDTLFEQIANARFGSPRFLYHILGPVVQ